MAVATMKVPTIFYAVDRFSDVVSKMTRKTAAFGETAQAAAMRSSRAFNSAGTNMLSAGVGMAIGIGYAVNEAVKFEKAMANVDTTIDSFPGQIKAMGNSVLEMSKKMPVPISQLTEALYDVVSAGIESKDAMMVLKSSSKLGVAGLGTAKEGVDVITSSLNAFNIKATESEKVANMVFKAVKYGKTTVSGIAESFGSSAALVKNSNVSLEEYLATTATLTTTGMTASRAQTQVSSAVTALIKPSGTMSKIFARLGVKDVPKWIKANGGLVNSMRIVRDEADKMGVLTSKAFGRKEGFSAMLSLLGPLADKFKLVYGDMTGNVNSLDSAFEKQQKTVSAGVQRMKNKLTVLAISLGEEVMPRINGFIDSISSIADSALSFAKKNEWLITSLLNLTLALITLGALAKVGAFLFYGYAQAIKIYRFAIIATTAASGFFEQVLFRTILRGEALTSVLWGMIAPTMAWLGPLLAIVAILALIGWSMHNSSITSAKFAQDKTTHFKIVSGQYETMEQRIARSNERIVANMKKLKMDLESVKKTGKTISELRGEQGTKATRTFESEALKRNLGKTSSGLRSMPTNLIIPKVVSDSDQAFNEIMADKKTKNLAGKGSSNVQNLVNALTGKKGEISIIIKGNAENVSSVGGSGDYVFSGVPVHTSSTKKSSNNDY